MKSVLFCFTFLLFFLTQGALADQVVSMHLTSDGTDIGTVKLKQAKNGLLLITNLKNLSPGNHGFHVHEFPSCENQGEAAGGHLDPQKMEKHLGPHSTLGHLGDLPVLKVSSNGTAKTSVLAPRLTLKEVEGHSLMIHEGGDNYSDHPEKLGGGGKRIACGVIEKS